MIDKENLNVKSELDYNQCFWSVLNIYVKINTVLD